MILTSCNSSSHILRNSPNQYREHSKYTGIQNKTTSHNNRKLGAVKCKHVDALYLDPEDLSPDIVKKDEVRSDLTLIILAEQDKSHNTQVASKISKTNKTHAKLRRQY